MIIATRTARRITCTEWAFKACKVQLMFQFIWNSAEVSRQLNNQVDYVFAVAAKNYIGVGEFSNANSPACLGEQT